MTPLKQLVDVARDIPTFFALKAYRWLLQVHAPEDVGAPVYTWCTCCSKPWPCSVWTVASDEITKLNAT